MKDQDFSLFVEGAAELRTRKTVKDYVGEQKF